ncbi:hypothetical protein SLA2020_317710 [Shorea laevis]
MEELTRVGAYTAILMSDLSDIGVDGYNIPTAVLSTVSGGLVMKYTRSVSGAKIRSMRFMLTILGSKPAPEVASCSLKGTDAINPGILKSDIIAPGVDVLAAVAPNKPFNELGKYKPVTDYALYSGTSMAAPHVAGVAALLKAVHPSWSPAAIKSAIMATAYTQSNNGSTLID